MTSMSAGRIAITTTIIMSMITTVMTTITTGTIITTMGTTIMAKRPRSTT